MDIEDEDTQSPTCRTNVTLSLAHARKLLFHFHLDPVTAAPSACLPQGIQRSREGLCPGNTCLSSGARQPDEQSEPHLTPYGWTNLVYSHVRWSH